MDWSIVKAPLLKLSELNGKLLSRMSFANVRAMHLFGGFSSIPFPVLNLVNARAEGTKGANSSLRLEAIVDRMPRDAKQVIDIGSNNGFFSIALGSRGYDVIGYEPYARFVRGATQICERFGVDNVSFFVKALDPDNSRHVFDADVSLVLSVYHNWVKQFGFDGANQVLRNLWAKTRMAMFFELASTMDNQYIAGFETMPKMGETAEACRAFMETMILGDLPGAQVEFVGLMPTDYVNGTARHFFVVRRK
jgi:SAM-dependent methyltransferase